MGLRGAQLAVAVVGRVERRGRLAGGADDAGSGDIALPCIRVMLITQPGRASSRRRPRPGLRPCAARGPPPSAAVMRWGRGAGRAGRSRRSRRRTSQRCPGASSPPAASRRPGRVAHAELVAVSTASALTASTTSRKRARRRRAEWCVKRGGGCCSKRFQSHGNSAPVCRAGPALFVQGSNSFFLDVRLHAPALRATPPAVCRQQRSLQREGSVPRVALPRQAPTQWTSASRGYSRYPRTFAEPSHNSR